MVIVVFVVLLFCCLWFVCDYQRDLRETLGFLCADRLSTLACYSPADNAEDAERMQQAAFISQRILYVVIGAFVVRLRLSA